MIRNLKALGLALVAVFAMSAMTASAASATDFFTTTQNSALLTGTSHDNVFKITSTTGGAGSSFECTTSKFTATVLNKGSEATVDPEYIGTKNVTPHTGHCTSSAGNVTIDMNGCHYLLTGNTTGHDLEKIDATIWVQCPAGQVIKITSSLGVTISIPAQTPTTGGVTYTNLKQHSGGAAVRVHATATGITANCAPAFSCGLAGIPTHGNHGDYTGTVDVTGYEDKDGLPTPITEGPQIPIEVS